MRFEPIYKRIKEICDAEADWTRFFRRRQLHPRYALALQSGNLAVSSRSTAQNILLGGGCHPFDLLRWTVGADVTEVHAYSNGYAAQDFPLDDCYIFTFQFENGCIGKVLVTSGCKGRGMGEGFLSIYGTEGTIWKNHIHHPDGSTEEIGAEDGDAIQAAVSHFVDCVINGHTTIDRCPRRRKNRFSLDRRRRVHGNRQASKSHQPIQ